MKTSILTILFLLSVAGTGAGATYLALSVTDTIDKTNRFEHCLSQEGLESYQCRELIFGKG